MARVQVVPPEAAKTWPICLLAYSGFVRSHPALRRIFHERRIVGDGPRQRDARPQLGRHSRLRQVIVAVRRRVIGKHVDQLAHERTVGMIDDVGAELAGRGFGLHARDQLPAGGADHLDADFRKALVELPYDLLLPSAKLAV
jgi:hypothetical protein